jgi:superfamily II DNA or RNA helicase
VPDPLQDLFDAVREACSARSWSRGIELARGDAVDAQGDGDPLELRVRSPGRTVAPTVHLYLEDAEWACTCDSKDPACEHVAAAIVAVRQAKKEGKLPASKSAGAAVGYRLTRDGERLAVGRVAVAADGSETPISGTIAGMLSGREQGPRVEPTAADLTVDQFLQQARVRSLPADRFALLLPLLAQVRDVRVEGTPVAASEDPWWPRVIVDRQGRAFVLRFEADGAQAVIPGVVMNDARLQKNGAPELTGPRLERLPCEERYDGERVTELVTRILPMWRDRTAVDERARVPEPRREVVRPLVEVEQRGSVLRVLGGVAYGDPPLARLIGPAGEKSASLRNAPGVTQAVERNLRAERAAAEKLTALGLAAGKAAELTGREAARMAARLRAEGDEVAVLGDAHELLYPGELTAAVRMDGERFEVSFAAGRDGARVDAAAVLEAWHSGAGAVPLLGGGWAELPVDWLERHGARVRDLMAARDAAGRVAPHSRPLLARTLSDLDAPVPADLAPLAALADNFAGIPRAPLPADLTATLRPYQQAGVDWLCFLRDAGLGALLADDMGLGKTLETLCAIGGRALIVCPRSVVHNWLDEIRRFRPKLRADAYHGADRELGAGTVVTTYALLRRDIERLAAEKWDAVVLDEAQAIKNPESQAAQASFRLDARFRVALSGTPVENRLDELWSLMNFTSRGLLGGRSAFAENYERPIAGGDARAAALLRERIRPFVLRRKKSEVLRELPPRTESVLSCELDGGEREVYDAIHLATRASVLAALEAGQVMAALEALLRLRQAACDVALVPGHGERAEASSKVQRLLLALEDAAADGHRALVFSQWTSLLDRVEPELRAAGIDFARLDGSTADRAGVVARFQAPDGPPVMLLSLKAGGVGLNLTAADHVFLLDPWWNPAAEDQAADRAHRIGQERPVMIYRLVAKDTVEERILELQQHKRALAAAALDDAAMAAALSKDDIAALFR